MLSPTAAPMATVIINASRSSAPSLARKPVASTRLSPGTMRPRNAADSAAAAAKMMTYPHWPSRVTRSIRYSSIGPSRALVGNPLLGAPVEGAASLRPDLDSIALGAATAGVAPQVHHWMETLCAAELRVSQRYGRT